MYRYGSVATVGDMQTPAGWKTKFRAGGVGDTLGGMRGLLVVGWLLTGVGVAQVPAAPVVHAAYPAGVGTALGEQIAGLLADPGASRAHWGIAVTAMDGTPIYEGRSEGKLFRPASNAKLFTTAAAMALLGPETRVTTVISADTPPDADGVIQGDIVLHGAGDANLSGRVIPYEAPEAERGADRPGKSGRGER